MALAATDAKSLAMLYWPPEEVARECKARENQVELIKQEQEHTAQGGEKNRRRA